MVELLDRSQQTEVALLDEVEQRNPRRPVPLRHGDDEAEIRLHELLGGPISVDDHLAEPTLVDGRRLRCQQLGGRPTGAYPLGQIALTLWGQQGVSPDFIEVSRDRILGRWTGQRSSTSGPVVLCHSLDCRHTPSSHEAGDRMQP